jgi:hypothetical protein
MVENGQPPTDRRGLGQWHQVAVMRGHHGTDRRKALDHQANRSSRHKPSRLPASAALFRLDARCRVRTSDILLVRQALYR